MRLLILSAFLFLGLISSQAQSSKPFKHANTIILETNYKADSIFLAWEKHLVQNGYSIDKSNKDFSTVTTGPKDTSRYNLDFIINSIVDDAGKIRIKIRWHLKSSMLAGSNTSDYYDWEYVPGKGSTMHVIHEDVMKVVRTFGDYRLVYLQD